MLSCQLYCKHDLSIHNRCLAGFGLQFCVECMKGNVHRIQVRGNNLKFSLYKLIFKFVPVALYRYFV